MKTHYIGHDNAYKKKRAAGGVGWAKPSVVDENIHNLDDMLQHVDESHFDSVCEIGCGAGNLTHFLSSRCQHITGIDISQEAIDWAHSQFNAPNMEFHQGNILDETMFEAAQFSLVVDGHCLHCIIGEDRLTLLRNIHGWLRKDGLFLVNTMSGEPKGECLKGFDPQTRVIMLGDIATRYIGVADDIISEIEQEGFRLARKKIIMDINAPDQLCASFQKVAQHQHAS